MPAKSIHHSASRVKIKGRKLEFPLTNYSNSLERIQAHLERL